MASDGLVKRARDQQTKWMTPLLGQMADRIEELEAERDEALSQLDSTRHSVTVLEANVARVRDALGKALERLDASAFTNAEHAQAAEILRAALQDT